MQSHIPLDLAVVTTTRILIFLPCDQLTVLFSEETLEELITVLIANNKHDLIERLLQQHQHPVFVALVRMITEKCSKISSDIDAPKPIVKAPKPIVDAPKTNC